MGKTSSDVTPWLPKTCCVCGRRVRVSKDSFGCSYAGTGTVASPEPLVWHLLGSECRKESG